MQMYAATAVVVCSYLYRWNTQDSSPLFYSNHDVIVGAAVVDDEEPPISIPYQMNGMKFAFQIPQNISI